MLGIFKSKTRIEELEEQMAHVHRSASKAGYLADKMQSDSMLSEANAQFEAFNELHSEYSQLTGSIWMKQGVS